MACKFAEFDKEFGRYYCDVTGSQCVFIIPNSKSCANMFDEGPDANQDGFKPEEEYVDTFEK